MKDQNAELVIRLYGADGSVETFVQSDPALADKILDEIQPGRLFGSDRVIIAGTHSLTAFVPAKVARIDFTRAGLACWGFPAGIVDAVELSEEEFRRRAHLDDPENLEKREQARPSGEFAVGFVDIEMIGGQHVFIAVEFVVGLPIERLQRINLLLSAPSVHFRVREGGFGTLNLGNLVRFTVYPGPSQAPAGSWPAHHRTR